MPMLWNWGFAPVSWQAIPAGLGLIYLAMGPIAPFFLLQFFGQTVNLYLIDQEEKNLLVLKRIDADQSEIERRLEETDNSGLVSLIHYSRLQLEAYYRIGLDQTQRSFRYSIISMWLGFSVIMIGISTFFLPVSIRQYFEGTDIKAIPIIGGVVIELISALFLWVYRSSIIQLTYFYNRQLDNHNVLICSRLASSMRSSDRAKIIIITKFMEYGQRARAADVPPPRTRRPNKTSRSKSKNQESS